jgi:hypothetical protein
MKEYAIGLLIAALIMFGRPILAEAYEVGDSVNIGAYCNSSKTTIDQLKKYTAELVEEGRSAYMRIMRDTGNSCVDANLHGRAGVRPIPVTLTKRLWAYTITHQGKSVNLHMWEFKDSQDQIGYTWLRATSSNPGDA